MEHSESTQGFANGLVREITLKSGAVVTIRPIRPEDAEIEREFIEGLSPRSRHLRFMGGIGRASDELVRYFTDIDYKHHMALIATVEKDGRQRQVAVGRFFTLEDGKSCEFALVVADDWQGRGIGFQIMRDLIGDAKRKGLGRMIGSIFAYNRRMIDLVRELGFEVSKSEVESDVVDAVLDLWANG